MQAIYDLGLYPALTLTSDQVLALSAADVAALRDDLGLTDLMLDRLRTLGRVPDRQLVLDFASRGVTMVV